MTRTKLTIHRPGYTRKSTGKRVRGATYKISDKGKPGRTSVSQRFFHPKVYTGWEKEMPAGERRRLVEEAHKGNTLAAARSMQALANVTKDKTTAVKARADALYFYREYHRDTEG